MAVDSAAERRLMTAKAAFFSVTPCLAGATRCIARENAILQSNHDIFAQTGGQVGDPYGQSLARLSADDAGIAQPSPACRANAIGTFIATLCGTPHNERRQQEMIDLEDIGKRFVMLLRVRGRRTRRTYRLIVASCLIVDNRAITSHGLLRASSLSPLAGDECRGDPGTTDRSQNGPYCANKNTERGSFFLSHASPKYDGGGRHIV